MYKDLVKEGSTLKDITIKRKALQEIRDLIIEMKYEKEKCDVIMQEQEKEINKLKSDYTYLYDKINLNKLRKMDKWISENEE